VESGNKRAAQPTLESLTNSRVDSRTDIVLPARLDVTTVADVRYALGIALDAGVGDLAVDVSHVEIIDAAGLGLLVTTHRRADQIDRRLLLMDPQPRLLRLLAVTRLHRVLHLDRPVRAS
jgi:anti-sigma B factor antagonist